MTESARAAIDTLHYLMDYVPLVVVGGALIIWGRYREKTDTMEKAIAGKADAEDCPIKHETMKELREADISARREQTTMILASVTEIKKVMGSGFSSVDKSMQNLARDMKADNQAVHERVDRHLEESRRAKK